MYLSVSRKVCTFANMKRYSKEIWLIVLVWIFIYASAALYMWYGDIVNDFEFRCDKLLDMWTFTTAYLIMFTIHHFFLVPKLFLRKRYTTYAVAIIVCMTIFVSWSLVHEPEHFKPMRVNDRHEMHMQRNGKPFGGRLHNHKKMLAPPDVARMIIALMMIGVDLGGVAWLNSQKLRQRLLQLEKQNLKQELEHLRYQINPHFFMNTLNNIHVLVDVDKERAKRAIIELSGLMRHSLYNGNESLTPLQYEIDFLRQYISLMQLRFGNRVTVNVQLPDALSHDIMIPPLLFATFVENAFKHGISYQTPSFINVSLTIENNSKIIHFICENSRKEIPTATQDGCHGIGLNNVRKRLDLQYGESYSMNINDMKQNRFVVELSLPIQPNTALA